MKSMSIFEAAQIEFYNQVAMLKGSKEEVAKLAAKIEAGKVRISPMILKDTRVATGSKSIEFFTDDDSKKVGVRNISEAMLSKGQFFLPYALTVTGAFAGTAIDESNIYARSYKELHSLNSGAGFENGDITLRVDDSPLMRELLLEAFDTEGQTTMPKGTIIIGDSEIVSEQQKIEAKIRLPFTAPDFTAIKVMLWGVGTYPRTN